MKPQILIAINSQDRLRYLMPHIERIAQPGMKIVFLMHCRPEWRPANSQTAGNVDWAGRHSEFIAAQRLLTEQKVFRALQDLLHREIEISVDVYTGSLRKVIAKYTLAGNVHLIMRRAGWQIATLHVFRKLMARFVYLKQPALFPVHLVHAN